MTHLQCDGEKPGWLHPRVKDPNLLTFVRCILGTKIGSIISAFWWYLEEFLQGSFYCHGPPSSKNISRGRAGIGGEGTREAEMGAPSQRTVFGNGADLIKRADSRTDFRPPAGSLSSQHL